MTSYVNLSMLTITCSKPLLQNDHWTARNHKVCEVKFLTATIERLMSRFRKNATGSLSSCSCLQRCKKSEWPFCLVTFIAQLLAYWRRLRSKINRRSFLLLIIDIWWTLWPVCYFEFPQCCMQDIDIFFSPRCYREYASVSDAVKWNEECLTG